MAGDIDPAEITRIIRLSAFLKTLPIFEDTPAEVMARVIAFAEERDYAEGDVIIEEGTKGDEFFVLRDGSVRIRREHGRPDAVDISRITRPGEYFGEIALFRDGIRTVSVVAEKDCRLLTLSKEIFFDVLKANLMAGALVEETVHRRMKALSEAT